MCGGVIGIQLHYPPIELDSLFTGPSVRAHDGKVEEDGDEVRVNVQGPPVVRFRPSAVPTILLDEAQVVERELVPGLKVEDLAVSLFCGLHIAAAVGLETFLEGLAGRFLIRLSLARL